MAKHEVVYGICTNRQILENAAEALKNDGFAPADVAFLAPESLGKSGLTTEKSTKAPEGAAAGAGSGLLLGGALGWFVGVGALAIPGIGPLIAAGPILAALAGAGVGSAVGGVTGALVGMGIPEYEAKRYEGMITKGGTLISVHCDTSEQRDRAKKVLVAAGAEDVSSSTSETAKSVSTEEQGRITNRAEVAAGTDTGVDTATEDRARAAKNRGY
jgi:rhodanese-related sulfurtransferase